MVISGVSLASGFRLLSSINYGQRTKTEQIVITTYMKRLSVLLQYYTLLLIIPLEGLKTLILIIMGT